MFRAAALWLKRFISRLAIIIVLAQIGLALYPFWFCRWQLPPGSNDTESIRFLLVGDPQIQGLDFIKSKAWPLGTRLIK